MDIYTVHLLGQIVCIDLSVDQRYSFILISIVLKCYWRFNTEIPAQRVWCASHSCAVALHFRRYPYVTGRPHASGWRSPNILAHMRARTRTHTHPHPHPHTTPAFTAKFKVEKVACDTQGGRNGVVVVVAVQTNTQSRAAQQHTHTHYAINIQTFVSRLFSVFHYNGPRDFQPVPGLCTTHCAHLLLPFRSETTTTTAWQAPTMS